MLKAGLAGGRVGVAGSDTLPWSLHNALAAALPEVTWIPADDILGRLRMVKSPGEVAMLRRASHIGSRATEAMLDRAVPGATHGEVVAAGMEVLVTAGGILYNSFMSSGKGGNNPVTVASSFPTWGSDDVLEDGDWFHVGISGAVDGYYFDHAPLEPVGHATAEQIRVFEAPLLAVREAMAGIRPGVTAAEIARAGREKLESLGFELEGSFKGFGHGIGLGWDSPWLVESDHTPIEENMVLCVERSVRSHGLWSVTSRKPSWSRRTAANSSPTPAYAGGRLPCTGCVITGACGAGQVSLGVIAHAACRPQGTLHRHCMGCRVAKRAGLTLA